MKVTNHIIILLFSLSTFLSCNKKNVSESQSLAKAKSEKIDSLALRYLQLNRFSGTIIVTKYGQTVYNQSFGLADYENEIPFTDKTTFKIGEITSIVTENILDGLISKEKIKLTDKLSKHLADIEKDLAIGDLLQQNTVAANITKGRLIEKVSNKSYQENIEQYSADLHLENTYFQKIDSMKAVGYLYHNYRGNGLELQKSPTYDPEEAFSTNGLKSTGSDLVKILSFNQKELRINGFLENDGFSYSLVNDTINNRSIIVLSNRRHPVADEISNSIEAILDDKEYRLPLVRKPYPIDKTVLKDYTGSYSLNENVIFEVQISNDSLLVLMGSNKVYLVPQSSNQFYMRQMDASMRFLRDSSDSVNQIVLLNGFIDSEQIAHRKK